ncbi:MAG: YaaC family protein [Candidatus Woesearchaeota archaeon]
MSNLYFIEKLENYNKILSDNPKKEIWTHLLKNCDVSYLKRQFPELDLEAYEFISTSINQAHEYYQASKSVSLRTRPLLLYYSILNLTKGVIYIRQEKEPSGYHGLSNTELDNNIIDMSAKINNGVYMELSQLLNIKAEKGLRITFSDFCNNIIELYWDYCNYFDKDVKIVVPKVEVYMGGKIDLTFSKDQCSDFNMIKEETNLLYDFKIINENEILKLTNKEKFNNKKECVLLMEKYFDFSIYPDKNYYLNINQQKIPSILSYFGVLFLLSDIVRYRPNKLYYLLDDKEESIQWFLKRTCDISERAFPDLLLNLIYKPKLKYATYN